MIRKRPQPSAEDDDTVVGKVIDLLDLGVHEKVNASLGRSPNAANSSGASGTWVRSTLEQLVANPVHALPSRAVE